MSQTRVPFKKFTEGDFICEIRRLNRVISKLSYERDDLQQENQQLKEVIEEVWNFIKSYPGISQSGVMTIKAILHKVKGE